MTLTNLFSHVSYFSRPIMTYHKPYFSDLLRFFILNMFPATPRFAHTQTTHPNNMIYLSPEGEWKHWLYAVILTLSFQDLGF